jgi:hypothetical protein
MGEPKIKGAAIRELFAWYEGRYGKERVRYMAESAPDDLRELLDPDDPIPILAASWYPARLVHSMLDTVTEGMTEIEIQRMAKEATRAVVTGGLGSVYRFVLEKLATPEMYAASIPRLWHLMHDNGERSIEVVGPGEALSKVRNWGGHHPLLCLVTIETMCAVFETMGCRAVKTERLSCVSTHGGDACVTRVTWRA